MKNKIGSKIPLLCFLLILGSLWFPSSKLHAQCKPVLSVNGNNGPPKLSMNKTDTLSFGVSCIQGCSITVESENADVVELAPIGDQKSSNGFLIVKYRITPRRSGELELNVFADCPKGTRMTTGDKRDVSGKNLYVQTHLDVK